MSDHPKPGDIVDSITGEPLAGYYVACREHKNVFIKVQDEFYSPIPYNDCGPDCLFDLIPTAVAVAKMSALIKEGTVQGLDVKIAPVQ